MPNTALDWVEVAVGVVRDATGKVLIALRDQNLHQGGLWEFPGGKLEPGETAEQALHRELKEELNISVDAAVPLLNIRYRYPDKNVHLQVFLVTEFSGPVQSCQNQSFVWVPPELLYKYDFPPANRAIINTLRLPDRYAILDDTSRTPLLAQLEHILGRGVKLLQARLKNSRPEQIEEFMRSAQPLCRQQQAQLLLNSATPNAANFDSDGLHLTSQDLLALEERPEGYRLLGASCHTHQELQHAQQIGVDFVVLGPVLPTRSHPDTEVLGWAGFAGAVQDVSIPVYALGGMTEAHLPAAKQAGAQGIAGISNFALNSSF